MVSFIRAGLILNAFLICLVYTYKIKGPWWALAAFVGCSLYNWHLWTVSDELCSNEQCVLGVNKQPNGFLKSGCIDMWHVLHLFFWILIGLLLPDMYVQTLIFSVLFEIGEQITIGCGRIEDVFINMAGYTIGSLLSKAR